MSETPDVQVYVKEGRPARLVRNESDRVSAVFEGFTLDEKASTKQAAVEDKAEANAKTPATKSTSKS